MGGGRVRGKKGERVRRSKGQRLRDAEHKGIGGGRVTLSSSSLSSSLRLPPLSPPSISSPSPSPYHILIILSHPHHPITSPSLSLYQISIPTILSHPHLTSMKEYGRVQSPSPSPSPSPSGPSEDDLEHSLRDLWPD
jgi:hypothetical protein